MCRLTCCEGIDHKGCRHGGASHAGPDQDAGAHRRDDHQHRAGGPGAAGPKRLFRSLQSAVPDNDLEMVVTRSRREKNGVKVGHRIDRTNMH